MWHFVLLRNSDKCLPHSLFLSSFALSVEVETIVAIVVRVWFTSFLTSRRV